MNKHSILCLNKLLDKGQQQLLQGGLKGIEKESLRISHNGYIAQTPHPKVLGSALTNPHITTDYSEALLEFITPPFAEIEETLKFLRNIHQFVYDHLDNDELLLTASMPCGIDGDTSIPIAEFGSSNIGMMKHIYRRGLWHRYGRTMQSIAGIHFNYSVPEALWPVLRELSSSQKPLQEFIADAYFGLIRNFQRQGWIILYLFGASPAICKSFLNSRKELADEFDEFDPYTYYHPYATSLRMSDIGYKSTSQANLEIDYNSLAGYTTSLCEAIETPYAEYAKIGIKVDGEYRQLNSNALQIENEYYSTIRPKQVAESCEKPTLALKRRGVRYVEIRSLDLDLHDAIGINAGKSHFIEAFLLTCLMQDSPANSIQEHTINNDNQLAVAHEGRKPDLKLSRDEQKIRLSDWAAEILEAMHPVCTILDEGLTSKPYINALEAHAKMVNEPDLTPSAMILQGMREQKAPFSRYALNISAQHEQQFRKTQLNNADTVKFTQCSQASIEKQRAIEASDKLPFDEFLHCYLSQTCQSH